MIGDSETKCLEYNKQLPMLKKSLSLPVISDNFSSILVQCLEIVDIWVLTQQQLLDFTAKKGSALSKREHL